MLMQRALAVIYPNQCVLCAELTEGEGGLCSTCWQNTPFISGHICDQCGAKLPGRGDSFADHCDDCLVTARPWDQGRAALSYSENGRRIVLGLKHGDRTDLVEPAAKWMLRSGAEILEPETLLVPIPIHWTRLVARRYNQAAELARALASVAGQEFHPEVLIRHRRTAKQDGMTADERFANMDGALRVNPRYFERLRGSSVCLVDDVMTSGATLSAATVILREHGVKHISVLVLARVVKEH